MGARFLLFLFMLLFCVIIIIPFLIMFFTSLKTSSEISSAVFRFLPERWLFSNYVEAMQSSDWGRFFGNSLYTTFLSVIISLVINSLAGYAFARLEFKGKDLLFLLALVGMMIPQQVTMLPNFVAMKYVPLAGGNNLFGQGWNRTDQYLRRYGSAVYCRSLRCIFVPPVLYEFPQIFG